MYDWHAKHPEKGKRFAQAMESVSQSEFEAFPFWTTVPTLTEVVYLDLDSGNGMIIDWLANRRDISQAGKSSLVIEVSGKTGSFSCQLAAIFPDLRFETQDSSLELLRRGEQSVQPELAGRVRFISRDLFATRSIKEIGGEGDRDFTPVVFLLRGVLWSLDDTEAIRLVQSFIPAMRRRDGPLLVISDLVSPSWGTFEPHVERAFRRRDVTLMTMHNVKQRTATEWVALIRSASPHFQVTGHLVQCNTDFFFICSIFAKKNTFISSVTGAMIANDPMRIYYR